MPNIQIKDVPADAHAVMRSRAARAGQSLQEYLLGRIMEEASRPTLDEILDRAERRHGGQFDSEDIREALEGGRARR